MRADYVCDGVASGDGYDESKDGIQYCKLAMKELNQRLREVDGKIDRLHLIAIIGGGIAGSALALALQRKGFRVRVFERDPTFNSRKQGYGLTSKFIATFWM